MPLYSGKTERLPYSLSRWTDLPAAKWPWFRDQLAQGKMVAFDPRTAVPAEWSLRPEDTMGLIFWTKNPENLIRDSKLLEPYKVVIHMTLTGWEEVEKGAPSLDEGLRLLERAVSTFGADHVVWRFSPVPLVPDVLERFEKMAACIAKTGLKEVFVSFLQENDLLPETRQQIVRFELLKQMAVRSHEMNILLCADDRKTLGSVRARPENLQHGICEDGKRFSRFPAQDDCGCCLAIDPFTINETCTFGCAYCYAADKSLAPKKRNTTKHSLPVVTS
jgi:hypothetical protein